MEELGGFIGKMGTFIAGTGQELSPKKSVVVSSTLELSNSLCERWAEAGIKVTPQTRVKALGVGLAAGKRRNATVAKARLRKYQARLSRFRVLKRTGISTARLVRTGLRAVTYGSEILGVPDGLLRSQRQVVAAITAPGQGTSGQNMDLARMVADGKAGGKADPAYDAHTMPIGQWAMVVWEQWQHNKSQNRMLKFARMNLKRAKKQQAERRRAERGHLLAVVLPASKPA